jgi:1,2-diacylglycerol 3-beta-glucosyltransferase
MMRKSTARHLVLATLALVWFGLVARSITYWDALWFRYYVVDLVWLQYLFLAIAIFGGTVLLLGVLVRRPQPGRWETWPLVSVILPAKDEVHVVEGVVRSACGQDYAGPFEVIVVDDRSTDGTRELVERLQDELSFKIVRTPAGTIGKAAALEVGIAHSRGTLIAVFDADARLEPDVLTKMVPHLGDARVGAVQGRRLVYNAQRNLLTRVQADEYRVIQTLLQRARQALGGFTCLAGNGLIVRRDVLKALGGWNEEALTEDIDLTVRLYLAGWEIRYCYDAEIWEEGVVTIRDLIRQRERWFEGSLLCLGDYLPQILFGRLPLLRRVDMLFFLGGALLSALAMLTGYVYALIGFSHPAVMYVQLPARIMGMASAVLTIGVVVAMTAEVGFRPAQLAGIMVRWTLFSWHTLVVVPLAIRRYLHTAFTGHKDWRKTSHEGARPDSPG